METEDPAGPAHAAADLLGGEDHDFVVNLYLAALGRWPDPGGYRKYRAFVAGRPERRIEALREVAASDEAVQAGARIGFADGPAVPPGPSRVLAISLALRTEALRRDLARLQDSQAAMGTAMFTADLLEARDAALHFEVNALRREVTDRLDGLLGPVGPDQVAARDAAVESLARLVAGHVADAAAALRAEYDQRFRGLEGRLLALEARRGG